jgi:hypothetical protein
MKKRKIGCVDGCGVTGLCVGSSVGETTGLSAMQALRREVIIIITTTIRGVNRLYIFSLIGID